MFGVPTGVDISEGSPVVYRDRQVYMGTLSSVSGDVYRTCGRVSILGSKVSVVPVRGRLPRSFMGVCRTSVVVDRVEHSSLLPHVGTCESS